MNLDIMNFSPLWGEWHIMEQMGRGAFGAVYRAEKREYGNTYVSAVKHISIPSEEINEDDLAAEGFFMNDKSRKQYCDHLRDQIINEINLCYALRGNSNIVSYEDHCIIPKASGYGYDIFIRMEFLVTLTRYIRDHTFSENDVIRLGIEMCDALDILNKHHIIHRDIKPANIFLNPLGTFKLGDFGESKVLSGHSVGMTIRGTYTYMSPEISRGASADVRADIYSLGLVMYRLFNGNKAPFVPMEMSTPSAQVVEQANIRRFKGERIPLPAYCKDPELINIIMKACEYLPQERWQTPQEMKMALMILQFKKMGQANHMTMPFLAMQEASASRSKFSRQPSGNVSRQERSSRQPSGNVSRQELSSRQPSGNVSKQEISVRQNGLPEPELKQPHSSKAASRQPSVRKDTSRKWTDGQNGKQEKSGKNPKTERKEKVFQPAGSESLTLKIPVREKHSPDMPIKKSARSTKEKTDPAEKNRQSTPKAGTSFSQKVEIQRKRTEQFLKEYREDESIHFRPSSTVPPKKADTLYGTINEKIRMRQIAELLKLMDDHRNLLKRNRMLARDAFARMDELEETVLKEQGFTKEDILDECYHFMKLIGYPVPLYQRKFPAE